MTKKLTVMLIVSASVMAASASAQSLPSDSADSTRVRLNPVTVTATRSVESIFAAPVAASVVTRERLDHQRGSGVDEALREVPGVLAQSRAGGSDVRLTIRGFGARGAGDRSNAGTSRGIRVLIDGIPETEPDGRTSFDLVDLAAANRIEIVRSNGSALWGNGAGGVVNVSTVPQIATPRATLQQMAGSFGFRRTIGQGVARFGKSALAFTYTNTGHTGWRDHSDSRRALINSSLTGAIGNETDYGIFLSAANNLFHIPGPLTRNEALEQPTAANATYALRDERRYNRLGRIGAVVNHSLPGESSISGMLFLTPKLLERSERNTYRYFDRYHGGGNVVYRNQFQPSPHLRATTLLGIDQAYQDGKIVFYSLTAGGKKGTDIKDDRREGALNSGLFVQQGLMLADQLNLEIGARYDKIRYDYRNLIAPGTDAAKAFARVTPRAGITYRASPSHSFYANIGGGLEAPAGNETDPASTFGQDTVTAINPLLDAIRSTTYEVGTRRLVAFTESSRFSSLSYDAALYLTDVMNEIIPYRGGRFYFSAGKVRRQGAEAGASLVTASLTELRGSVTYSRNRYVRYVVDSVHYGRPGSVASFAGNQVAGIPGLHYSVALSQEVGPRRAARLELSLRGVGDYFTDDANAVLVPAYATAGLTLSSARLVAIGSLALRGFVSIENIANRSYIGSAFVNPDVVNGQPVAFEPGTPRSVVVSLSIEPRRR